MPAAEASSISAPGCAAGGRYNFGLNESVVRLDVLDKVKEAKAETVAAHKPNLLTRGPQWAHSVALSPSKYERCFSEQLLTNTLTAAHVSSSDTRKLAGSTHVRAEQGAGEMHTRRAVAGSGWDMSIVTDSPLARARTLEASTSSSLSSTQRAAQALAASGKYTDPVTRQAALSQRIREHKANSTVDVQELEAQYGPEGAGAMQHILSLQTARQQAGLGPVPTRRRRVAASREDLSSIKALDAWEAGLGVTGPGSQHLIRSASEEVQAPA